jgi:hypothetical protein
MNQEKKFEYRYYVRAVQGEDKQIGSLLEKRRDPERITHASIMNYIKEIARAEVLHDRVYFVRLEI